MTPTLEEATRANIDSALLMAVVVDDMTAEGLVPHFNAVVERMAKDRSRQTVSLAHDVLEVEGYARSEWTRRPDGKHVKAIVLTPFGKLAAAKVRAILAKNG